MAIGTAAAVLGGAAISSLVGSKSASKASKAASNAAANELGFAQRQYDDWKAVYGDLQENLGNYYNSLDVSKMTTEQLQIFEREKDAKLTQVRETLEQRGIATSGLAASVEKDFAYQSAVERAKIRAEAPMKKAALQQQFLQIGLGQNPADNIQDALGNQTRTAETNSQNANQNASAAVGGLVTAGVNYFSSMPRSTGDSVPDYNNANTSSSVYGNNKLGW
jgi:hypothetical protein